MIASDRSTLGRPVNWRSYLWVALATLFLCPLIVMQFTSEVAWTRTDFLAAAILLAGVGAGIDVLIWLVKRPVLRAAGIATVLSCGTLIWADGAVGIF